MPYDYDRRTARVNPSELAALKAVARKSGDRDLQQLAEALEDGNMGLADQYFQVLRAKKNLHDVPDGIVGELGRRNR